MATWMDHDRRKRWGPGIRDSGFLCRSLRDLASNVQTNLVISDCIQQRTLGVLMTLELGVSLPLFLNQDVLFL